MTKRIFSLAAALVLTAAMCFGLIVPGLADGNAPVAENFEFETYRGVSFGGTLCATDPDGEKLSFQITTEPVKGSVELNDDGSFVYTPDGERKGRDYFGYTATDESGNVSQEATVIIKFLKQKTDVSYSDMQGKAENYAALRLAECGIFTGAKLGENYCFQPDATLSRGEFLTMCMELCGEDILSGVVKTGFTDDDSIPVYQKSYVSTAVLQGYVSGKSTDNGLCFDPDAPVSGAEAAAMLSRCMHLSDVSYVDGGNVWAAQAAANLKACNIISGSEPLADTLSRAEAAMMLSHAMDILENR